MFRERDRRATFPLFCSSTQQLVLGPPHWVRITSQVPGTIHWKLSSWETSERARSLETTGWNYIDNCSHQTTSDTACISKTCACGNGNAPSRQMWLSQVMCHLKDGNVVCMIASGMVVVKILVGARVRYFRCNLHHWGVLMWSFSQGDHLWLHHGTWCMVQICFGRVICWLWEELDGGRLHTRVMTSSLLGCWSFHNHPRYGITGFCWYDVDWWLNTRVQNP